MKSEHTTGSIIYGLTLALICQFFGVWAMLVVIAVIVISLLVWEAARAGK